MLSIKPKTAFTNILEGGLSPTAINSHYDRRTKTIISEPPVVLYKIVSSLRLYDTYGSWLIFKHCLSIFL